MVAAPALTDGVAETETAGAVDAEAAVGDDADAACAGACPPRVIAIARARKAPPGRRGLRFLTILR
jgi:hypothetical protein